MCDVDGEHIEKRMYLRKDEQGNWYFSLIPFEELEPENSVVSYPSLESYLDSVYEILIK